MDRRNLQYGISALNLVAGAGFAYSASETGALFTWFLTIMFILAGLANLALARNKIS